jgi:trimeric autotransporter adhesin
MKKLHLILFFVIQYSQYGLSQNCPEYSSTVNSPAVACANQPYTFQINNTACNGTITFNVVGNYGSNFANEITWNVTSNQTGGIVASGGPGTNNGTINVTVGPLNPAVVGNVFTLTVNDAFGDGFNGTGGTISVSQGGSTIAGPITGNFGASASSIFGANVTISSSTLTINTPSGPVVSTISNCNNVSVPLTLQNTNFCTPLNVNLPWTLVCNATNATLASGTHSVTVNPRIPTSADDLISISWNSTSCSWDVEGENDCDLLDVGTIFTISPNPSSLPSPTCGGGSQGFEVAYIGVGGLDCCSTGGPLVPIVYSGTNAASGTAINSPFGGTNNSAVVTIPANQIGGNATSLTVSVDMSGYCYNPPGTVTNTSYWVTVYHNNTIIYDQQTANPGPGTFSQNFNLAQIPGYNENSVITVYIYPNAFSGGGVNTTYLPNGSCPMGTDGGWTAGSIGVTFNASFEQLTTSPAVCTFTIAPQNFLCCSSTPVTNEAEEICSGEGLSGLGAWQTAVNAANSCVVFSSVTPVAGSVLPDNNMPSGVNNTAAPITQSVNAYAYCDTDGNGAVNAGDTYTLISNYTVTVNPIVNPTFNPIADLCQNATAPVLPLTSNNGIEGTWNPAIISTATVGTTTYTFTPNVGECANITTLNVTITNPIIPTFDPIADLCQNATAPVLPLTSTNGISGTWNPAIVSTSTSGTSVYTFTPDGTQCAAQTTLSVTITPSITPDFDGVDDICEGEFLAALPTTSLNGITGTWSPAIDNSQTTTYTFTPDAGQCALETFLSIGVVPNEIPVFDPVADACQGSLIADLPTTSTNGITGTWSPAIDNTQTTTYTFTPDAGQCSDVVTLEIVVTDQIIPTFDPIADLCQNAIAPSLPTTSLNGITGTWNDIINTSLVGTTTYIFTADAGQCAANATLDVTIIDPIIPQFDALASICQNGVAPTLSNTSNNGITGTWSPAIDPATSGVQTLQFTFDAGQCATNTTLDIEILQLPTITVNSETICTGVSATLTATGADAGTYTWSPADGLSSTTGDVVTAEPDNTTMYTITGTLNGCSSSTTATVTVDNNLAINVAPITICANETGTLEAFGANTYEWSPATGLSATTGNTVSVDLTETTTYTVVGNSNGCIASVDVTVTVNEIPTIDVISETICEGDAATLTATGADSYSWSPDTDLSATNTPTVTSAATSTITYTVTGTTNGCSATADAIVTVNPIPTISVNSETICPGVTATLTATGGDAGSYTWSPGTGLSSITDDVVTANPATTTTYTITGSLNGCPSSTTATVTVLDNLVIDVDPITICANETGILTASGANSYTWSPATGLSSTTGNTVDVNITETTTYTVTGNSNGCLATTDVTVTVNEVPTLTVNSESICEGSSTTLTATGGTTYTWTPSTNLSATTGASVTANPATTTTYTVTGTSNGCSSTATSTVIVNPIPVVTVNSVQICNGETATLTANGATTYTWSNDATLNTNTGQTVQASPSSTTSYVVTGTSNGCSSTATSTVTLAADLLITVANQTICEGSSVVLSAAGATNYTWSPATGLSATLGGSVTANPTTTTTYTITGNTGVCSGTTTATVTVNPAPSTNVMNDISVCQGQNVTVPSFSSTPAGSTFTWTSSNTNIGLGASGNGNIAPFVGTNNTASPISSLITVTPTLNGCIGTPSTFTITINPNPVVIASNNGPICQNSTLNLTANSLTGASFGWSGPNGFTSSDQNPVISPVNSTNEGVYTVVATLNGCISTATTTFNLLPPTNPTITQVGPFCLYDAPMNLTGSIPNGTWSGTGITDNQSGSFDPAVAGPGVHVIEYATTEGCGGLGTISILVNVTPTVSFSANSFSGCTPVTVTFSNTTQPAPQSVLWDFGNGQTSVQLNNATSIFNGIDECFDVTLTATSNGCTNSLTIPNIVCLIPNPIASFTSSGTNLTILDTEVQFTNTSQNATTYVWNFGSGNTSNQENPSYTYEPEVASYSVMLVAYNDYGCSDTAYQIIRIKDELIFYIPNTFTPDGDEFNNTFKPIFYSGIDRQSYQLKIYNRWGQLLFESRDTEYGWDGTYDGELKMDGTYVWTIKFKDLYNDKMYEFNGHVNLFK